MQKAGGRATAKTQANPHNFGHELKAARAAAAMTQAALQQRLKDEFEIEIDTSGITRMEAGQREPRLDEALAIAAVFGLNLADLASATQNLDRQMNGLSNLMSRSRETLEALLQTVDQIIDYTNNHPESLGDASLENLFRERLNRFQAEIGKQKDRQTAKRNTAAEKLKREVLVSVTSRIP